MRSVWIFLSSVAAVVAIGGTVYHFIPRPQEDLALPDNSVLQALSGGRGVLVVPAGNPLLAASELQLGMWIPKYPIPCGDIVFAAEDDPDGHFSFCVKAIRDRVAFYANLELSENNVLDPLVRAHWRATVGRR